MLIAGVFLIGLYPQPVFDAVDTSTNTVFVDAEGSAVSER